MTAKKEQVADSPWWYQGQVLTDDMVPEWATGFVYKIVMYKNKEHKQRADNAVMLWGKTVKDEWGDVVYIGKKQLTSTTRSKIGVREKAATKTRKTFKKTTKQSAWKSYWSSCKELQEDVKKSPELFERHIIEFCFSKKNTTYLELKYQFLYNVLERDTYNRNLNGSLYKHDTDMHLYKEFLQRKKKTV